MTRHVLKMRKKVFNHSHSFFTVLILVVVLLSSSSVLFIIPKEVLISDAGQADYFQFPDSEKKTDENMFGYQTRQSSILKDLSTPDDFSNGKDVSIFLKFKRALKKEEIQILQNTLNVSMLHAFATIPLYLFPHVPSSKLARMPKPLASILESIYPNIRQETSLACVTSSKFTSCLQSENITLEELSTFKDKLFTTINVASLHSIGITGENVTVGIIDTGINPNHQELKGKVKTMASFVKKELGYSATIDDVTDSFGTHGHGTGVASLIVGKTIGVAPNATLVSAKVIHDTSVKGANNGSAEETTGGILAAIDFLVEQQVDIISISLGQYLNLPDGLREEYIDVVSNKHGIVFVIAAGNFGYYLIGGSSLSNPGTSLQAITVGSSRWDSSPSSFSSEGPRSDGAMKPDLLAPGESVIFASSVGTSRYVRGSGTSFATPIVSGVAALLISAIKTRLEGVHYNPGLIKAVLLKSARLLVGEDCIFPTWKQGFGLVDAQGAWTLVSTLPIDKSSGVPLISLISPLDASLPQYKIFFRNHEMNVPLTIVTSLPIQLKSISLIFDSNLVLKRNISETSNVRGRNSMLIDLSLMIPNSIAMNISLVTIKIDTNDSRLTPMASWQVFIKNYRARVLIDISHALIARRGVGTYHYVLGNTATMFGGFRELAELLLEQGIAIDVLASHRRLNASYLAEHDAFFLIEPATRSWHPYMDWMPPNQSFLNVDASEIATIVDYSKSGGKILVLARGAPVSNISNVNELLKHWGLSLQDNSETATTVTISETVASVLNVSTSWEAVLTTTALRIIDETRISPLMYNISKKEVVGVAYHERTESIDPSVLVFASSSLMDNFGLKDIYDAASNDIKTREVVIAFVTWLLGMTPLNSDSVDLAASYCDKLPVDATTSIHSGENVEFPFWGDVIVLPPIIITIVLVVSSIKLYKSRKKNDE